MFDKRLSHPTEIGEPCELQGEYDIMIGRVN